MRDIKKELRGIVILKIFSYVSVIIYPIFILFAFYYLFLGTTIELKNLLIAAAVWGIVVCVVSIIKIKHLISDYKLVTKGEYSVIVGKIIYWNVKEDEYSTFNYECIVRDNESGEEFEIEFTKNFKTSYDPEKDYVCYGLKNTKFAYCEELENTSKN